MRRPVFLRPHGARSPARNGPVRTGGIIGCFNGTIDFIASTIRLTGRTIDGDATDSAACGTLQTTR